METLVLIGLVGGLVTGISPCILPMIPVIVFAGGVESARGRTPTVASFADATSMVNLTGASSSGSSPEGTTEGRTGGTTATLTSPSRPARSGDGSGSGSTRRGRLLGEGARPYLVIAGIVTSFSFFTLLGSLVLAALGLPQDVVRWIAIGLLVLIGVGMIVPRLEAILEKPFSRISIKGAGRGRQGFLLGLGLGVLYVPCAGPVLSAITVAGATGDIGVGTVVLTVSFAVGAAIPMLILALASRRVAERSAALQRHQRGLRIAGGLAMIGLAAALVFNLPQLLQRTVPDYTGGLQQRINDSEVVAEELDLGGLVTDENRELANCSNGGTELEECGTAPALRGLDGWFNTDAPLDLEELRGQVVLLDFWAYSCINCQRAIPHVNAWHDAYAEDGLQVIGIHTPEFAFEREARNVRAGAERLDIEFPVAQDNDYATWTAYRNRYWPAQYLIDAEGTVRHIRFGEGNYAATENLIRELLQEADPGVDLGEAQEVDDATPSGGDLTPETFFALGKTERFVPGEGERLTEGEATYSLPASQPQDTYSLEGEWSTDYQGASALQDARVRLAYNARDVHAVIGGEGTVVVRSGDERREVEVSGAPQLYDLVDHDDLTSGELVLEVPAEMTMYTFTFG